MNRRQFTMGLLAATAVAPFSIVHAQAAPISAEEMMGEMVLGQEDAPITIVAYESLTCPHCASFHAQTLPDLKKNYIDPGKAKLIMRGFPFENVSLSAHMMARCAGKDRYFGLLEVLFRSQKTWAGSNDPIGELRKIGRLGGLDDQAFDACLANEDLKRFIVKRMEDGNKQFSVDSTPTFVINGEQKIVGAQPYEAFDKILSPLVN